MKTQEIKKSIEELDEIIEKFKDNLTPDQLSTLSKIKQKLNKQKTKENLIALVDLILKIITVGTNLFKDG